MALRNIKLIIEYDGTRLHGWQIQDAAKRTVQGEIEKACKKVFKKSMRILGSGRTDSGVHAIGQVANLKIDTRLSDTEIVRALNASLPEDIAIIEAQTVAKKFHAQYSAKSKIYRYTILNRRGRSPLARYFCHYYPHPLDVNLMRREAKVLVGKRDFKSFQATPARESKEKSTIRMVKKITLTKKNGFIHIDIEANGFLHKMVRNIIGTLLEIGSGRSPKGSMKRILEKKNRLAAGRTAKAKGLCLLEVKY